MLSQRARDARAYVCYLNGVGGQDELVFDGQSLVFGPDGGLIARAAQFQEQLLVVDLDVESVQPVSTGDGLVERPDAGSSCQRVSWGVDIITVHQARSAAAVGHTSAAVVAPSLSMEAEVYAALCLGVADYVRKNHFEKVVMGISGGIDSALTVAIAVDALGARNVWGVLMPSPYSSAGSIDDALAVAANLGIRTWTLPIAPIMGAFDVALAEPFSKTPPGVTEENIQARIRGNLLMALSNKFDSLLLTTGNKSELAVGYCTLYGDMSGGLAVIADVPKTMVYRIARWRNARGEVIPESTLTKAPSAELRPNQTDQDSLPPYEVLDAILERHIEQHQSLEDIVAAGFDETTARRVLRLVRTAEFKRKQAAPGLKVTDRAFGSGWRMPIARGEWDTGRPLRDTPHL